MESGERRESYMRMSGVEQQSYNVSLLLSAI